MQHRVDPIADENDELHRRVAQQIRRDPTVVARAAETLERWLAREPLPAWIEWRTALVMLEPLQLADFLESTTPRARRMKISSPFLVVARELASP